MKKIVRSLWLATAIALSGCAIPPQLSADVSVFHQLPAEAYARGATYAVMPWRQENSNSLEFQSYADQVRAALKARGMNVAPAGGKGTYVVFLDVGIDDGRQQLSTYQVPNWGVTGYSGATTTGTISTYGNTSYYNANTSVNPTYGVTGYSTKTSTQTVYRRFMKIDIVRLADGTSEKVYEGRLKSEGSCGNLVNLVPQFVKMMLSDYPGKSGASGARMLPWAGNC